MVDVAAKLPRLVGNLEMCYQLPKLHLGTGDEDNQVRGTHGTLQSELYEGPAWRRHSTSVRSYGVTTIAHVMRVIICHHYLLPHH